MIPTYLFILIIGSQAQSFEVDSRQECLELKETIDNTIKSNEALKDKAATGCFRNLGIRTNRS